MYLWDLFTGQVQSYETIVISTDEEAARYGLEYQGNVFTGYYLEEKESGK